MKNNTIIHPEKRYAKAPDEILNLKVSLNGPQSLLVNDDRNVVMDIDTQFDKERNDSLKYKIYGKMKMVFRNMYSCKTYGYEYLEDIMYVKDEDAIEREYYLPYNEFAFIRNDICRETSSSSELNESEVFTGYTRELINTGTTRHKIITENNAHNHNWGLYLTYAFSDDSEYPMEYTLSGGTVLRFYSGDGIPFRIVDDGNKYTLTSPVEHGMNEGEFIIIDNYPYYINSIGNEIYNSEDYVISILKNQIPSDNISSFTSSIMLTGKRCLDKNNIEKTTSKYYIHKNKVLTEIDDYILEKIGFETPTFKDEKKLKRLNLEGQEADNQITTIENNRLLNARNNTTLENQTTIIERNRPESIIFDFNEPFVLTGITSNLGYTPTDIYLSVVYKNGDGFFEYPPKVGYRFNFHDEWIDECWTGSTETGITVETFTISGITFSGGTALSHGDVINGEFVEYVPTQLKERTICHAYHKIVSPVNIFNHNQDNSDYYSGANEENKFGLFYQPHHKIKLRELSPSVETSNSINIDNLPQNARFFVDEKIWKWRDLYDHGYIDDLEYGTNYPFMNGMHYVKSDINFYLMNEVLFTNKIDGIRDFNSYLNKNTLKNRRKDKNNNNNNSCH